jgi:hypothetical protein
MPLDRAHVTVASRIMLPMYVVFFAVVGANYLTASMTRLQASPMLRYADRLMSIRVWGALFLGCALLMLAALIRHNRSLYRYGLFVCFFSALTWTAVAIAGIFAEPVSYSAWAWPALVAAACMASNRSLAKGELDEPRREG